MALNIQTLKTRALTAVVFAAVMLAGLLWSWWSFLLLFTIIHFGCWVEYLKLVEKIYNTSIGSVVKYFFAICGVTCMLVLSMGNITVDVFIRVAGTDVSLKILSCLLLFAGLVIFMLQNKKIPLKAKGMALVGFLYITLPFTLLLNIRTCALPFAYGSFIMDKLGILLTCVIIFSIWINDTMAYIVGSLIGKTPFSKISPKKTWEGTLGGAILAVLVIGFVWKYLSPEIAEPGFHISFDNSFYFIIPAICAVFGTLGDLLESKLKRMAGVKDSGSIMPGHGGFLDRFDSLLVATPFVWLYLHFIAW